MNLTSLKLEELVDNKSLLYDFVEFFFGFRLYNYQLRFINECLKYNRVNGLWARQSGKSQAVAVFIIIISMLSKKDILIAAPTDAQAKLLYDKVIELAYSRPELRSFVKRSIKEKTDFITGSTVVMITVGDTGSTKRGYTCDILIEEEAQSIKDTIHNTVLMPFIASKKDEGKVIKIGTPSKRNHFYESCYNSSDYQTVVVKWEEVVKAGQYSLSFIEEQKKSIPEIEFNAEYCAMFIDDVNAYFPIKLLESCMLDYKTIDII